MSRPPTRAGGNDKCGFEKGQIKPVDRRPTPALCPFLPRQFPPPYKRPPDRRHELFHPDADYLSSAGHCSEQFRG